ncbi:MAG: cytochrome P450, partial [Pseudomonadota bacterium]
VDAVDLPSVLGLPDWVPRPLNRAARQARDQIHDTLNMIIDEVEKGRAEGDDAMIQSLFAARDRTGAPLSREAIRNEAIVIFMAGHETTANTLAWAIYLVSQCARVRAKLHAELERVLSGRVPDLADLPNMPYTRAVVEETLRLYPPVPLLGRTAVAPGTVNGLEVRKGASLIVAPWLIHRNAEVWSLPDHFVPERFDKTHNPLTDKHAFIPFASGPRVCPGLTLAMTEAMICLATLLQTFDMRVEEGHEVAVECRLTLRPGNTLPMRVCWRPAAQALPPPKRAMLTTDIPWQATFAPEPVAPPLHNILRRDDAGRRARRHHVTSRAMGNMQTGLNAMFARCPPHWSAGFGSRVLAPFARRHYRGTKMIARMEKNLSVLAPQLTVEERDALLRRWFANTARAMSAYAHLTRLVDPQHMTRLGQEHLEAAKGTGRSIVMTTVHTSAWELNSVLAFEEFGERLTGPFHPQPSRFENRIVTHARRKIGVRALPPGPNLSRTLLKMLQVPGGTIVLVIDEPSEGDIKFPLFGRDWPTRCGANFAVKVAAKTDALILPTTLMREEGTRSTFRYHKPIDPAADGEDATRAALNGLYEPFILSHLDQWYMLQALKL